MILIYSYLRFFPNKKIWLINKNSKEMVIIIRFLIGVFSWFFHYP